MKDPDFKGAYQANISPDTSGVRGYKKHQRIISKRIAKSPTRKFASSDSFEDNKQYHYPTDNKKIVYGRMTGWGQEGTFSNIAGHDLN